MNELRHRKNLPIVTYQIEEHFYSEQPNGNDCGIYSLMHLGCSVLKQNVYKNKIEQEDVVKGRSIITDGIADIEQTAVSKHS